MFIFYILVGIAVFLLGIFVGSTSKKEKTVGTLIIDNQSIPEEEPYLFLESKINPREYMDKKSVVFDVTIKKLLTHD